MDSRKLIIIGLDGATFNLIVPWVKKGKLKTFEKLLTNGTWGELESTKPPLTCPAWPSFMTGKNPGKYGVFDFIVSGENGERVVNFLDIAGEPFWDTAARAGLQSIIINVPVTYPPQIANGIMLSGMMTPPNKPYWTDKGIIEEIKQSVGEYILDLDILTLSSLNRGKSMHKVYAMMESRYNSIVHMRDHYPFDLMVAVFRATDIVCHRLWNREDIILQVYETIDRYLKEFINENNNLFIMSDHGFASYSKGIRINQYLYELGFLVSRKAEFEDGTFYGSTRIEKLKFGTEADWLHRIAALPWRLFLSLGFTRHNVAKSLKKIGLYEGVRSHFPRIFKRVLPLSKFMVDRAKSKAYLHSKRTNSITINHDLCTPNEYQKLRDVIKRNLLALKDPETGERVIRNVFEREEIYHGKYIGRFPGLYIEPEKDYLLRDDFGDHIIYTFPSPKSSHAPSGIFIGYGPDIVPGKEIEDMSIIDIAPTVLHLLNVEVPEDMDGRVFRGIFRENSEPSSRQVRYSSPVQNIKREDMIVSREDDEAIKEGLKALGYID